VIRAYRIAVSAKRIEQMKSSLNVRGRKIPKKILEARQSRNI